MLKNMKKTRMFLFIIFFISTYLHPTANNSAYLKKEPLPNSNLLTCQKELLFIKHLSFIRLITIPTLASSIYFINRKYLFNSIKENPLLFTACSCIFINSLVDIIIKYKQISHILCLFELSKKISRYMLYAIAIKNTLTLLAKKDINNNFTEENFFSIVTQDMPLSFHELEMFIFDRLHACVKTINTLHIKIHSDAEEQIYLLCKDHVTLDDVLKIYGNDPSFYPLFQNLQENPNQYYKIAALTLNTLIKEQFQYMIKHQPNLF